jgi:hypothetical protein
MLLTGCRMEAVAGPVRWLCAGQATTSGQPELKPGHVLSPIAHIRYTFLLCGSAMIQMFQAARTYYYEML